MLRCAFIVAALVLAVLLAFTAPPPSEPRTGTLIVNRAAAFDVSAPLTSLPHSAAADLPPECEPGAGCGVSPGDPDEDEDEDEEQATAPPSAPPPVPALAAAIEQTTPGKRP